MDFRTHASPEDYRDLDQMLEEEFSGELMMKYCWRCNGNGCSLCGGMGEVPVHTRREEI
jgi:hypothetical protein